MSQNASAQSFALRCGRAAIWYRHQIPTRTGSIAAAARYASQQDAEQVAVALGLGPAWVAEAVQPEETGVAHA